MAKNFTNKKPKIGIIKNCKKIPIQTILKFFKILKKSSTLNVNPIENIIKLNKGIIRKLKFDQYWGSKKAQNENKITQRGNKLVDVATKFFIKIIKFYKLLKILNGVVCQVI